MLNYVMRRGSLRQVVILPCLFGLPALPCYGGIIFEETFDSQANWNMDGSINKDCGTNCQDAPPNWNAYYAVPPIGSKSTSIEPIPDGSADHTGGSARKAFISYYSNIQYSGGAMLSKTFAQDYPELYLQAWLKTQPGWQTAPDSSIKMFRIGHYDGTGSAFEYFPSGHSAPIGLLNWGTSSQWRGTDGCYIPLLRCDPQETSYYCPQPPYDVDTPQRITAGVSPSSPGGFADGGWHRYDLHVRMNTQTGSTWNKNGMWEFSYDGTVIRSITDIQWKYDGSGANIGWNTIQFGGNSDNVYGGDPSAQWVAFDDIVVSTTPIPDNYVIGGADRTAPNAPAGLRIR